MIEGPDADISLDITLRKRVANHGHVLRVRARFNLEATCQSLSDPTQVVVRTRPGGEQDFYHLSGVFTGVHGRSYASHWEISWHVGGRPDFNSAFLCGPGYQIVGEPRFTSVQVSLAFFSVPPPTRTGKTMIKLIDRPAGTTIKPAP